MGAKFRHYTYCRIEAFPAKINRCAMIALSMKPTPLQSYNKKDAVCHFISSHIGQKSKKGVSFGKVVFCLKVFFCKELSPKGYGRGVKLIFLKRPADELNYNRETYTHTLSLPILFFF